MQSHEKDLVISFYFSVFWKTNYSYLSAPIKPLKILFCMFTSSELATKSYSIKQGVPLLFSISLKISFGGIFNKVAGWKLATLVKENFITGAEQRHGNM